MSCDQLSAAAYAAVVCAHTHGTARIMLPRAAFRGGARYQTTRISWRRRAAWRGSAKGMAYGGVK